MLFFTAKGILRDQTHADEVDKKIHLSTYCEEISTFEIDNQATFV